MLLEEDKDLLEELGGLPQDKGLSHQIRLNEHNT